MNKAGNAFNDRSHDLESGADRAAQLLALVTEVMRRQAEDLSQGVGPGGGADGHHVHRP